MCVRFDVQQVVRIKLIRNLRTNQLDPRVNLKYTDQVDTCGSTGSARINLIHRQAIYMRIKFIRNSPADQLDPHETYGSS